jgi:hypothetical protein
VWLEFVQIKSPHVDAETRESFEVLRGAIAYREYFDEGFALSQLGFAPDAVAKVLRKRL